MGVGWSHMLSTAQRKVFETNVLVQGGFFGNLMNNTRIIGDSENSAIPKWSETAQDKVLADLVVDRKRKDAYKAGAIDAAFKRELAAFERAMQQNKDERFGHPNFVYADVHGIKLVGRHENSEQDIWNMKINYRKICSHSGYFSKSITHVKPVDGETGRSIVVLDVDKFPEITMKALHDAYKNKDLYHRTAIATIQNRFIVFKAKDFKGVATDFIEVVMPFIRDGFDVESMPVPANVALGSYPQKMDFLFSLYTAAAHLEMHAVKLLIGKDIVQTMDQTKYPDVFDFAKENGDDNLIRAWADKVGAAIQDITFPILAACGHKHLEALLQSEALNLPEEDILYLLMIWRNSCSEATDEGVKDLMEHIRLPFVDMQCASAREAVRRGFISEDLVKEIDEFQKDHENQHLKLGDSLPYQIRQNKWNKEHIRSEIWKQRGSHLDSLNQPTTEHASDGESLEEDELFDEPKGPTPEKPMLAAAQKALKQRERKEIEDALSVDSDDFFDDFEDPPPAKPIVIEMAEEQKENGKEGEMEIPATQEG